MEACGSALLSQTKGLGARTCQAMGHEARLIPPIYVKPYVKRGKNDAAFAAAVCEALSRPNMRFVPVKSAAQQGDLMLHQTRELLVAQRTIAVKDGVASLAYGPAMPFGDIWRSSASSPPRGSDASLI